MESGGGGEETFHDWYLHLVLPDWYFRLTTGFLRHYHTARCQLHRASTILSNVILLMFLVYPLILKVIVNRLLSDNILQRVIISVLMFDLMCSWTSGDVL